MALLDEPGKVGQAIIAAAAEAHGVTNFDAMINEYTDSLLTQGIPVA